MELTEVHNKIREFHTDWYTKMVRYEGGKLVIQTPFLDADFKQISFKLSQALNEQIEVSYTNKRVPQYTNFDFLVQLLHDGGYKLKDDTISKVVDPMLVVDSMNNFIEFIYSGQFMSRMVEFMTLLEQAETLTYTEEPTENET